MTFNFSQFAAAPVATNTVAPVPTPAAAIAATPVAAAAVQHVVPQDNPYADLDSLEVKAGFAPKPLPKVDGREAKYVLGIKKVARKRVNNSKGGKSNLTEFTCQVLAGDGPSEIGSEVAITFWEGNTYDDADLKKLVLAVENLHHKSPIGALLAGAISPAQAMAGKVVGCFIGLRKEKYTSYRPFPAGCVGQDAAGNPVFDAIPSNLGL